MSFFLFSGGLLLRYSFLNNNNSRATQRRVHALLYALLAVA